MRDIARRAGGPCNGAAVTQLGSVGANELHDGSVQQLRDFAASLEEAVARARPRRFAGKAKRWADCARGAMGGVVAAAYRYVRPAAAARLAVVHTTDGRQSARPAELLKAAHRKLAGL